MVPSILFLFSCPQNCWHLEPRLPGQNSIPWYPATPRQVAQVELSKRELAAEQPGDKTLANLFYVSCTPCCSASFQSSADAEVGVGYIAVGQNCARLLCKKIVKNCRVEIFCTGRGTIHRWASQSMASWTFLDCCNPPPLCKTFQTGAKLPNFSRNGNHLEIHEKIQSRESFQNPLLLWW